MKWYWVDSRYKNGCGALVTKGKHRHETVVDACPLFRWVVGLPLSVALSKLKYRRIILVRA